MAEQKRKERESATSHIGLEELEPGTKVHRLYKGARYDFTVEDDEGGKRTIRLVKPRKDGPWTSLSAAAQHGAQTGHAENGATVLRRADGSFLKQPPRYEAIAAGPPPTPKPTAKKATKKATAKRTRKPRAGTGKDGSVKRSFVCQTCNQKFTARAARDEHTAEKHPVS